MSTLLRPLVYSRFSLAFALIFKRLVAVFFALRKSLAGNLEKSYFLIYINPLSALFPVTFVRSAQLTPTVRGRVWLDRDDRGLCCTASAMGQAWRRDTVSRLDPGQHTRQVDLWLIDSEPTRLLMSTPNDNLPTVIKRRQCRLFSFPLWPPQPDNFVASLTNLFSPLDGAHFSGDDISSFF